MPSPTKLPLSESSRKSREMLGRIERELGSPGLSAALVTRVAPTDLESLLLEVFRQRGKRRAPREVLQDYLSNRLARPSSYPPYRALSWDSWAFAHLPARFEAMELSPVAPVGTVAALTPISQDWIVTTIRRSEVVSDSSNVLGLECAARRIPLRKDPASRGTQVHLATSQRVLRAQPMGEGPGVRQHFRLFSLCSSGRDSGDMEFEVQATNLHLGFYLRSLQGFLGKEVPIRVGIMDVTSTHRERVREGIVKALTPQFPKVRMLWEKGTAQSSSYYRQLRFHVYARHPARGYLQLVDGGDVDWSQQLLNDRKERMVISGLGSDRLCELFVPSRRR